MIKKTITYKDFDGNDRSEEYRFHLYKHELIEMNFSAAGGMDKIIQNIIDTKDTGRMLKIFKDLIMRAYGELSTDGKTFIKVRDGHKLVDDFVQTPAYEALYMELITDDKAAAEFINGIIPNDLKQELASRG